MLRRGAVSASVKRVQTDGGWMRNINYVGFTWCSSLDFCRDVTDLGQVTKVWRGSASKVG
jgi:hypothetical protein